MSDMASVTATAVRRQMAIQLADTDGLPSQKSPYLAHNAPSFRQQTNEGIFAQVQHL